VAAAQEIGLKTTTIVEVIPGEILPVILKRNMEVYYFFESSHTKRENDLMKDLLHESSSIDYLKRERII
jgi:hypothetical protein